MAGWAAAVILPGIQTQDSLAVKQQSCAISQTPFKLIQLCIIALPSTCFSVRSIYILCDGPGHVKAKECASIIHVL